MGHSGRSKYGGEKAKLKTRLPGLVESLNTVIQAHGAVLPVGATRHPEVVLEDLLAMFDTKGDPVTASTFPWYDATLRRAVQGGTHESSQLPPTGGESVVSVLGIEDSIRLHQAYTSVCRTANQTSVLRAEAAAIVQFHTEEALCAQSRLNQLLAVRASLEADMKLESSPTFAVWNTRFNAPPDPEAAGRGGCGGPAQPGATRRPPPALLHGRCVGNHEAQAKRVHRLPRARNLRLRVGGFAPGGNRA